MTKVTYYMYSCDTCCKIREMMEMNGRECVKCQNQDKRDISRIMRNVNDNKTRMNSIHLPHLKAKNVSGWKEMQWA